MDKLAIVRVKGSVDAKEENKDTLKLLRLNRPNHCKIVDKNDSIRGMLQRLKEIVTWGEIDSDTLEEILIERGELEGGKSISDDIIQEETSYETVGEFAEAVCSGEASLEDIEGLKEVFRLHPPKKGFESTHRSTQHNGALGYRGEEINDLIQRML